MLQINKIFPLRTGCQDKYEGVANDGCNFYLTVPKSCEVHKYDLCLNNKVTIRTCRGYKSICYDECNKCFWAIASKFCNKIFKLDSQFKEKECISIDSNDRCSIILTGISCCKDRDKLLVSFTGGIMEVDKCNKTKYCILQKSGLCKFTSIECLCNYYVASKVKNSNVGINIYSYSNELKLQCYIPEEYHIEDTTNIYCGNNKSIQSSFYILATKSCSYSYLMKGILIYNCDEPCECMEEFFSDKCINEEECCNKKLDCKKNFGDIVESIALIETSLSHILNAEGEKIQKSICMSKNPCELLKVNDSVNKTIMNITHLEQILFSKLQLASEICPSICSEDEKIYD